MKSPVKILIVVALAATVVAAVALKQDKGKAPAATNTASTPAATNAPAENTGDKAAAVTKLPKLIDLGAGKCIPCKMMAPILEELRKEYAGRMDVIFVDVWEDPDAGKAYSIEMIPTQIFYDAEGNELFRHAGFFAKDDILAKWRELGVDLGTK